MQGSDWNTTTNTNYDLVLHAMNTAIFAPSPKGLALVVKQYAEEAPKQNQRCIRHDRWNKPA
jgi:hypothetical protein